MNQPYARMRLKRIVWLMSVAGLLVLLAGQPLAIAGIHLYQQTVAPLAARAGLRCRFTTSCSRYAEAAIARDGLAVGGAKALRRIARCGPWTAPGTIDAP
jgi:putative component of membrane protein insertase Oxa1/YidC/SpoIIIJ protein YidD